MAVLGLTWGMLSTVLGEAGWRGPQEATQPLLLSPGSTSHPCPSREASELSSGWSSQAVYPGVGGA